MNKLVLAMLVTTLTFAPTAPAQSCALAAYNSCFSIFPGRDSFTLVLQGFCTFAQFFLCDAGM